MTRAHEIGSWSLSTHPGADALHERRPAFQGGSIAGWCARTSSTRAAASASRCARPSRRAMPTWPFSPAARCRTASTTTTARKRASTRSAASSTSRSTCAWSSCGSRATGPPSAACCPSTTSCAWARAACTTRRCCWGCWAGTPMTSRWRSSPTTSPVRVPARSTRSSAALILCRDSASTAMPHVIVGTPTISVPKPTCRHC